MKTLPIILVLAYTLKDMTSVNGCGYFHYFSKQTSKCEICPYCGDGMGAEINCGHDSRGDRIQGKSGCKKCSKREFRKKISGNHYRCVACRMCNGETKNKVCIRSSDSVCGCEEGYYYDEKLGTCRKCSSCRGESKLKNIPKCLKDGMTRSCSCSDEGPGENRCRNTHLTTTQIFSSTYRLQTTENTSKSKKRSTTAAKSSSPPRSYKMHIIKLSSIFIRTKSTKPTTITPKATPSKAIPSRGKASTMLLKDTTTQNYHTSKGRMITQKNHTSKGLITRQKYHTSKGRITRQRYHTSRKPTQTTKPLTPTTSSDNDTGESVYNRNHTMTRVKKLKSSTRIIDTVKGTPSKKHVARSFWMFVALGGVVVVVLAVVFFARFVKNEKNQPKILRMSHDGQVRNSLSTDGSIGVDKEEEEEKEEEATGSSLYVGPAIGEGLKAKPFIPSADVYLDVPDEQAQPSSRNSRQRVHPDKEKLLNNGSLLNKSFSANDPEELRASERWFNQKSDESQIRLLSCRGTSCSSIGKPSFQSERRLYDLGECEKRALKEKLELETEGINNWKEVAVHFKVPQDTIMLWKANIRSGESPTEALLYYLGTQNKTVDDLLTGLRTLKRLDAHEVLIKHLRHKCYICR